MTILLEEYSEHAFNDLPPFEIAGPRFNERGGETIIREKMQPLFQKYGVEDTLGLQLLHQHFKLEPEERLVDFNGTSIPSRLEPFDEPCVSGSIWGLNRRDGKLVLQPLEFTLNSGDPKTDSASPFSPNNILTFFTSHEEFLHEWLSIVEENHVEGLFGLANHPGIGYPGRVEISQTRMNINLRPDQAKLCSLGKTREAAWFFDENFVKHGCRCLCPDYGGGHAGYKAHVITQS